MTGGVEDAIQGSMAILRKQPYTHTAQFGMNPSRRAFIESHAYEPEITLYFFRPVNITNSVAVPQTSHPGRERLSYQHWSTRMSLVQYSPKQQRHY
ncbi:hypothetical protein AC579_2966 [Pseudocercospora musae]|uniref:Uncharacterized protein n=1 Tax=Pseudocercospora musae TaxID=113226 RepID=A0A139I844_9PEZI|nr:hypothetical protein AC579_2966 [Pseudocercospora musae]KXT10807.1 hypothetical protein AC579_2966 [Pseudocercospora musae]KXT10809.1 hypothetical protein AC579_2966 [Pseudocercospora musae]KXT10811.1 hypothetical protein AC579_2966 [Pseudocercospora musae]